MTVGNICQGNLVKFCKMVLRY